jgi:hypothetical protein
VLFVEVVLKGFKLFVGWVHKTILVGGEGEEEKQEAAS